MALWVLKQVKGPYYINEYACLCPKVYTKRLDEAFIYKRREDARDHKGSGERVVKVIIREA